MTDSVILIVDDEKGFVDAIAKRLTKREMTVFKAYNGDMALHMLTRYPEIETVVLDMKMPLKDGITVLEEIKETFPMVEVIMLTGHATVETAIEGIQKGAYDYLMKPCDIDLLARKIQEAVELKREHEGEAIAQRISEITYTRA